MITACLRRIVSGLAFATLVVALTACVGMPTETHSVADMRAGISFKAASSAQSARVLVDGLDVGAVGDYLDGQARVRVRSGTHIVRVLSGNQILLDEKVYLGDGVNRSFLIQ
jgi:hypothetical protein